MCNSIQWPQLGRAWHFKASTVKNWPPNCDNCRMEIKIPSVVALTWTLKDTLGEVLDTLDEPVEFFIGGQDLLPKIEQALQGHEKGAKVDLHLEPEDAFGDFDENLLFLEPLALFPEGLEPGLTIEGTALPQGCHPDAPRNALYTVTEIYPEHAVLDANHPLSGIALRLSLKVESVREPTDDELGSGSCGTGFFKIEVGDEDTPMGPTLH
jgi:FKBP-type peptidyl-prolyl cis-trans isomerase SlyD